MKKLKKLSSLIVALTLLLSPLQIQAQTGAGSGGSSGGGSQPVPSGSWGISSAYNLVGTKVSLVKARYASYENSEYSKGLHMIGTPLGASPGYSFDATSTTGVTPVYFAGSKDSRVTKEAYVDGSGKYQLRSGVDKYTVQNAGYYTSGTNIPNDVMRAVITALSIDYKSNYVPDLNDTLRLPENSEQEIENQTDNQAEWSTNVK